MPAPAEPRFDTPLTACPLCESAGISLYDVDHDSRQVFRCRDCRVMFMNPQYSDEHLAEFYGSYTEMSPPEDSFALATRRLCKLNDFEMIHQHAHPGRFLGIGVGDGLELQIARDHGWEVEGYDVDERATRTVAAKFGVKVHSGNLLDLRLPPNTYDCIYMDQVLEHPKNPQDYLRESLRLLSAGGVLFIGCPNIGSLASRGKTLAGKLGLKKRKSRGRHYDMWHHLFYYSPGVLGRIMETHFGYRVLVAEGAPLAGTHHSLPNRTWMSRTANDIRRRFPVLESTFRLLAQKPVKSQTLGNLRKAA